MQAHNKNVIKFKVYNKGNGQSFKWGNISYSHERDILVTRNDPILKMCPFTLKEGGI